MAISLPLKTNNMKLIKLSADCYIIVDDSKIKIDDYFYNGKAVAKMCNQWMITFTAMDEIKCKKITHSTQPIEHSYNSTSSGFNMRQMSSDIELVYDKIQQLSLSEVKELLGEVDVEKKSYTFIKEIGGTREQRLAYIDGYREAIKDNKDRIYTVKDMKKMFAKTLESAPSTESHTRMISDREYRHFVMDTLFNRLILRSQPKTQWDVQFVDGKLKLI